jgi:hypothetical protein
MIAICVLRVTNVSGESGDAPTITYGRNVTAAKPAILIAPVNSAPHICHRSVPQMTRNTYDIRNVPGVPAKISVSHENAARSNACRTTAHPRPKPSGRQTRARIPRL